MVICLLPVSVQNIKLPGQQVLSAFLNMTAQQDLPCTGQRADCRDFLSLTSCTAWRTFHRSPTATSDMAGLAWSPDSTTLAIWDSALGYKVLLYGRDGSPKASYSAYDDALGVRAAAWSPGGQLLAVGSCDEVLLVLSSFTSNKSFQAESQLYETHVTLLAFRKSSLST